MNHFILDRKNLDREVLEKIVKDMAKVFVSMNNGLFDVGKKYKDNPEEFTLAIHNCFLATMSQMTEGKPTHMIIPLLTEAHKMEAMDSIGDFSKEKKDEKPSYMG